MKHIILFGLLAAFPLLGADNTPVVKEAYESKGIASEQPSAATNQQCSNCKKELNAANPTIITSPCAGGTIHPMCKACIMKAIFDGKFYDNNKATMPCLVCHEPYSDTQTAYIASMITNPSDFQYVCYNFARLKELLSTPKPGTTAARVKAVLTLKRMTIDKKDRELEAQRAKLAEQTILLETQRTQLAEKNKQLITAHNTQRSHQKKLRLSMCLGALAALAKLEKSGKPHDFIRNAFYYAGLTYSGLKVATALNNVRKTFAQIKK